MRVSILALLVLSGAAITWVLQVKGVAPNLLEWWQAVAILIAFGLVMVPPLRRVLARGFDVVRAPSPRARTWTFIAVWAITFNYLYYNARNQHRNLVPRIHDECSYTIQAHMLSNGRLWYPQHPLADFFETFHVLTKPVYASIYFPGTGLLNVPGILLSQPPWFMPVVMASLVLAMTCRITTELIDGIAGLLAMLLLLSTLMFRLFSTMVMAQVPLLLLALLAVWAWLHWRQNHRLVWAVVIGFLAGWAAITRPVDAVAFMLPIVIAMAWDLRRGPRRAAMQTLIAVSAAALPFIALQVVFNFGVTGSLTKTPYVAYLERYQPGSTFGSGLEQIARPDTQLPQKQIYFTQFASMEIAARQSGPLTWFGQRLFKAATAAFPSPAVFVLVPAAMAMAHRSLRWVVLLPIPLILLVYAFNPFFLVHYAVPLGMAAAFAVVLGSRAVEEALPWPGYRQAAGLLMPVALLVVALGQLPQFNPHIRDELFPTPFLDYVERTLKQVPVPAVVFFHFVPGCNVEEEPVYTTDQSWPDDAAIIRVHDLGPRNVEVLQYYRQRQPERSYFIMDRASGRMYALGNAMQAAQAFHVSLSNATQPTPPLALPDHKSSPGR
jgi:hypothetical protein